MKNKKTLINIAGGFMVGLIVGACAMIPVARHQYKAKGELAFYLDAIIGFIDQSPECKTALESL